MEAAPTAPARPSALPPPPGGVYLETAEVSAGCHPCPDTRAGREKDSQPSPQ